MFSRLLKLISAELSAAATRGDEQLAEVATVVQEARQERLALYLAIRRARAERHRLDITIRSA